jgi:hypothetical protein
MTSNSSDCPTYDFNGKSITLTSRTIQKYICEWHLDSFAKAIFWWAPKKAIAIIAKKMGLAAEAKDPDKIIEAITPPILHIVPPLEVFKTECKVTITDCVINHVTNQKQFGIGLQIEKNNDIGPVKIDGIAFLVKATPVTNEAD